jgi:hypothetical protein
MARYATHPIEQQFQEWNQRDKMLRSQYWAALRAARTDYMQESGRVPADNGFYYHLQRKYGVKPDLDPQGNLTATYTVVDKKKFLLFQLEYFK